MRPPARDASNVTEPTERVRRFEGGAIVETVLGAKTTLRPASCSAAMADA